MKNLTSWFNDALTREEYIGAMKVHRENSQKVFENFALKEEDKAFLETLKTKQLKAIALTADWCGDAMVNLPIFMHLAEEAGIDDRYLIRDENLELMDQYLTNGKSRSIPIIILLNSDGNEITKWGPRAPQVELQVEQLKKEIPTKDDPGYERAFKQFITELTQLFVEDTILWESIKNDLIKTLAHSKLEITRA